ncbi:PRD domain-containing protein [Enterococcus sp. ARL09-542]|uniref:sigma 54-interacting transcriptional regulator n=1 Tax=Enterococcus TaxID=1350 RepID=UPI0010C22723|nr:MULTISPECIES: sigma 54-interacting transcriptional regulator [Enterococcus]NCE17375.1 PRD domain-containing protein [Enterococcus gallinarum]TKL04108.1 PRD domain-containing protein [Enterococcus sp. ARL09-542]
MKTKILKELNDLLNSYDFPQYFPEECNAQYIAQKFQIKRNTASKHLNELMEQKKVVKINGRPVLFFPVHTIERYISHSLDSFEFSSIDSFREKISKKKADHFFNDLIGAKQSLKEAVQQGISAMKYPGGLPIMYFGSSGVGKSYLVEKLAEYCRQTGIIHENAPFIELNCAQYFNNSELLTSQLFGHMKGSFTGADSDHIGIIEAADGGIVFLDEIHRLPPEGQEKLFIHMDKGVFRRVGDSGPWRLSHVRYIFATTEQEENFFLETFRRRIPIVCTLPNYQDREISERKEIVFHLLEKESTLINKEILVSEAALSFLIRLDLYGNIGELDGLIKQTIANKLFSGSNKKYIEIHISDLPSRYLLTENIELKNQIASQRFYIFSNGNYVHDCDETSTVTTNLRGLIHRVSKYYSECHDVNRNSEEFRRFVKDQMAEFNDRFIYQKNSEVLVKYYLPEIQNIVQKISPSLFVHLSGNTVQAIATYLAIRDQWGYGKENASANEIEKLYENLKCNYLTDLNVFLLIFENALDTTLTIWDKLYISLCVISETGNEAKDINAIILAHGYATASSIANVANRLVNQFVIDSIDMPLDISFSEVIDRLLHYIEYRKPKDGLVIFVDMGSLAQIKTEIEQVIEVPTMIINNVTTEMAIETAQLIQSTSDIQKVVKKLPYSQFEKQVLYPIKIRKRTIVVSCNTGLGTSIKIKEMMENNLSKDLGIEFLPYENETLRDTQQLEFLIKTKDIIAIIGTDDPRVSNIPYISLEELFDGEIGKLYKVLLRVYGKEIAEAINQNIVKNSSLNRLIDSLTILDAEKVVNQIEESLKDYQMRVGKTLSSLSKINLYVHISCMIERLIRNQGVSSYPAIDQFLKRYETEVASIQKALSKIEKLYNIKIPMEEIAYVCNIIVSY